MLAANSPCSLPCSTQARRLHWHRHRHVARLLSAGSISRRPGIVATSEFWWEDEQEFDAITEVLLPKAIHLLQLEQAQQHLDDIRSVPWASGFTASKSKPAADAIWQQLKRAGPPYFLKLRTREALDTLLDDGSNEQAAAAAAEAFWSELCSQSWKVELDYGLAGADSLQKDEKLLVLAPAAALQRLLQAADLLPQGQASGSLQRVELSGWNVGLATSEQQVLKSWRDLKPVLVDGPAAELVPGSSASSP